MIRNTILAVFAIALPMTTLAQTPDSQFIAPGENLVVEGVPPIPVSLADEARRSAGLQDWHPARKEMFITTRFGNDPHPFSEVEQIVARVRHRRTKTWRIKR